MTDLDIASAYPKHFVDDCGYRWYCDEKLNVYPEQEGGYTLECGCIITEPLWATTTGEMKASAAVTNSQMHLQNDPTWKEVQKTSLVRPEDKAEVYRIANAIEVRVESVYPELMKVDSRPWAWVWPATILLGLVPQQSSGDGDVKRGGDSAPEERAARNIVVTEGGEM